MASEQYIIIPGTSKKVFDGSVVMLHRLPNLRWILHNGYYVYNGRRQKGWYFSSIPSDTTMPVFQEDLVAMTVIDGCPDPRPFPPCPPIPPPGPFPPHPPVPVPVPFTPTDKINLDSAMLTVEDLEARDKLSNQNLIDGKLVRVNDIDGHGKIEYYTWNSAKYVWEEASLGYRYMTRDEITEVISSDIVDIQWNDENGALVLMKAGGTTSNLTLNGITHDPTYSSSERTLTIPIYGKDDLVMTIPADKYIRAIRFEREYEFPDGHTGPAIVVTVSDGETEEEIAGDATGLIDVYVGGETPSATITVETAETGVITADVKISDMENNRIKIDRSGLYVDVSDLEDRITNLENKTDVGEGDPGEVVITTEDGLARSTMKIGDTTLSGSDDELLATEAAVKKALTWQDLNT